MINLTCDDIYALLNTTLPRFEEWEYNGARYCPIPPTEQELDHYVLTGLHPVRPSSLRIW